MSAPDRTLTRVAAVLSAGAGLVHVGLAGEHAEHHWTMGVAFLLAGVAQLGWSAALLLRYGRRVVGAGALLQLACVAALVATATVGWPVGPEAWQPEQVSTAALVCLALELSAAAGARSLLIGRVRLPSAVLPLALVAVVASSSGALAAGSGHAGAGHDGGGHDGAGHATAHEQAQVGRLESGEPEAAVDGAHADGDSHPPESHAPSGHAGSHTTPHATPDATAGAGWARATGHAHGPVDSTPPTAAQRAAADELLRASHATMPRYALASVARADGYRVVHDDGGTLLHYLNPAYARDGREVVAQRIESLLYVVVPGGGELLVGGMYTVPKGRHGPAVGGSLTPWHAHDDLCLHPAQGIALTQLPGGGCPPGSAVGTTGEMMHVWAIDYPGGPFGELDAVALRTAVLRLYGIADAT